MKNSKPRLDAEGTPSSGESEERESREATASGDQGKRAPAEPEECGELEQEASEYVPPDEAAYQELLEHAAKAEVYRNELLRVSADLDNYQKRVRRERPQWEAAAVRRFVRDLLPVVDNFERALETATEAPDVRGMLEGVRMIYQMLQKTLSDHGVTEIDALHRQFDPEVHEAVVEEEVTDRPTGQVLEVHEKGYVHRDVVIRPSRVKVAKKVAAGGAESGGAGAAGGESE